MNRFDDLENLKRILITLKTIYPDLFLISGFMIGFPGESLAAFQDTLNFVGAIPFDYLRAYRYSQRENTAAYSMSNQVTDQEYETRFNLAIQTLTAFGYQIRTDASIGAIQLIAFKRSVPGVIHRDV